MRKRPWRVLLKNGACHFHEYKQPGYCDSFPYDIQRIDMGIATAHFDHSTKEKGIKGRFDPASELLLDFPDHFEYAYSWLGM